MRFAAGILLVSAAAGCTVVDSPQQRYERWLAQGHGASVRDYENHLRAHHVDGVVPMPQLLRIGRHWRRCRATEFAVPPRDAWSGIVPTLVLVRELKGAGLLREARVASAWRSPDINHCEGGSARSRHLHNNALDFDVALDEGDRRRLCEFWRRSGADAKFGLGFYRPTKIHVDTSGFRTWGPSYRRASSLCLDPLTDSAAR
jgi:hypothetical protein